MRNILNVLLNNEVDIVSNIIVSKYMGSTKEKEKQLMYEK